MPSRARADSAVGCRHPAIHRRQPARGAPPGARGVRCRAADRAGFAEDLAAEISGAYSFSSETNLREFLTKEFEAGGGSDANIYLRQQLDWYTHADFVWSPFHGKIGLFTAKLMHFDFYTAIGAGVMGLTVNEAGPDKTTPPKSAYKMAGNIGVGTMAYILDWLTIRLDYRHYFHEFAGKGGGLSYPAEITLGVGFFTPAPQ